MNKEIIDKLLLNCVGIRCSELTPGEIEQLSGDDWDEIIRQSSSHKITSILCNYIKTLNPDIAIPFAVKKELQEAYLCNSLDNVQRFHNLSDVLSFFQDNGISVIILKGGALAGNIYQSLALRPMDDIDLLVKSEDIHKVNKLFAQLEYMKISSPFSEDHSHAIRHDSYVKRSKDADMVFKFDVHTQLFEIPGFDPWENASPAKVGSVDTFTLSMEDVLLHLCIHLDKYLEAQESRLIWWHDIAEILSSYEDELDWEYIIQVIQKYGIGNPVRRILRATAEWFDISIHENIVDRPESNAILADDMLLPTPAASGNKSMVLSPLIALFRIPFIQNKLHFIFRGLFPPRDFLAQRYSISKSKLIYFYYPFRMIQCGIKSLKMLHQLPAYLKSK